MTSPQLGQKKRLSSCIPESLPRLTSPDSLFGETTPLDVPSPPQYVHFITIPGYVGLVFLDPFPRSFL